MRDHMPLGNPFGGARALAAALLLTVAATGSGHAQNYSVVYSFQCGTDGEFPAAGVIADNVGNLYGTTELGGDFGFGTVFEVSPDGTKSVLHSFAGAPTDGDAPLAPLLQDNAGNLYGTTLYGGANGGILGLGQGTVFEVAANGTESVLYSFGAYPTDGSGPVAGLVRDAGGNLYGTTLGGGANITGGTVFKVSPNGKETLLHSFAQEDFAGGDGSVPQAGLVADGAGNLYGTTTIGGDGPCQYGCGTVFKVDRQSNESVLYSFAGAPTDGASPATNLLRDAAGNLYGTTQEGGRDESCTLSLDPGCGMVFKLAPDGTETMLFSFNGQNGDLPYGNLVQDGRGDLYGFTAGGGSTTCGSCGVLFEVGPTGKEGALHKFAGPPLDGSLPAGLLFSHGALFGVTILGGADNCGTVFKITP